MVLKKKTSMLQGNGSIFVLFLFGEKVWNLGLKNRSIRWNKKNLKIWSYEINLIINPYVWISVSLEEFKKKFISADGHGTEVVTKTEFVRRFSESWSKNKYLNRNNCITLMDVSSVRMMTSVAKGDILLRLRKMSCFNHTVWIINHKWCGITKAPTALLSWNLLFENKLWPKCHKVITELLERRITLMITKVIERWHFPKSQYNVTFCQYNVTFCS